MKVAGADASPGRSAPRATAASVPKAAPVPLPVPAPARLAKIAATSRSLIQMVRAAIPACWTEASGWCGSELSKRTRTSRS